MSRPERPGWCRAEAARLISFGRAAALPDGGFGWLTASGRIDTTQLRPLYATARMIHVFALAYLNGTMDTKPLAASGLQALDSQYADRDHGGWFTALDFPGRVTDATKANYAHASALLAASSALVAGIPGAEATFEAIAAIIERHFWSDDEGCARERWDAGFTETEPYRGANSNMHSVEAYLAAGDVTGDTAWHARAMSIADIVINGHARANSWRVPEHYDDRWQPLSDYHAYQAVLFPSLPLSPTAATALARQAPGQASA